MRAKSRPAWRISRRAFLAAPAGLLLTPITGRLLDLPTLERPRVLRAADRYLRELPITITAASSPRSAGGRHDYFSEGDYWWPDPANPDGPYIQRDGMSNPDNFVAHRQAMIRLSLHVPALAAAWRLTRERRYADHASRHLRAWFMDDATRMNPHLLYAQAIKGRVTGRGIGIIDTLHLVEVARAIAVLEADDVLAPYDRAGVRAWFERYLTWMTTHEYGQAERDAKNNHGTCWVAQVAEFARYTGRADLTALCRERFRAVIVPGQIAPDGSFPEELRRTKPYGYSLFNLDAMATVCLILDPVGTRPARRSPARLRAERAGAASTKLNERSRGEGGGSGFGARESSVGPVASNPRGSSTRTQGAPATDLWHYETSDGRGIRKALAFMFPFIKDKSRWPYKPDVMYHEEWPVRHAALLFGGLALNMPEYVDLWRTLKPDPVVDETIRNYFLRQPLLWV